MSFPMVSREVTKQSGCEVHTPWSTTTLWFLSEMSPEAAGKPQLAVTSESNASLVVTVTASSVLREAG